MVSKIEPDRYADTGFSIADTPAELNALLFRKIMEKSGTERMVIACSMNDTARELVWSGIPKTLTEPERRQLFLDRFYGKSIFTAQSIFPS
jgi:hypothetical protein